jgi:hypothetical protein
MDALDMLYTGGSWLLGEVKWGAAVVRESGRKIRELLLQPLILDHLVEEDHIINIGIKWTIIHIGDDCRVVNGLPVAVWLTNSSI